MDIVASCWTQMLQSLAQYPQFSYEKIYGSSIFSTNTFSRYNYVFVPAHSQIPDIYTIVKKCNGLPFLWVVSVQNHDVCQQLYTSNFQIGNLLTCMQLQLSPIQYEYNAQIKCTKITTQQHRNDWINIAKGSEYSVYSIQIFVNAAIQYAHNRFYIAYFNGIPATTCYIFTTNTYAYMAYVETIQKLRGKKIASQLTAFALNDIYKQGIQTCTLMASEQGQKIYDKFGFIPQNQYQLWH